jgi:hypothetical protein
MQHNEKGRYLMKKLWLAGSLLLGSTAAHAVAQATALQCTVTSVDSIGPHEREWYDHRPFLKDAFAELQKPFSVDFTYEFLPNGKVAVSMISKDITSAGAMTYKASSLVYSLASLPNPSRPDDIPLLALIVRPAFCKERGSCTVRRLTKLK